MKKIYFLVGIMVFLVSCTNGFFETNDQLYCPNCNVIIINVELLRADFTGIVNGEYDSTPNINEFFKNGIIFTQAQASSGETLRSLTSTFTGMETFFNTHSKLRYNGRLRTIDNASTLAQVLQKQRYTTQAVVQGEGLELGNHIDRGFDQYDILSEKTLIEDLVKNFTTSFKQQKNKVFYYLHSHSLHRPYVNSKGIPEDPESLLIPIRKDFKREIHNLNLRNQYRKKFNKSDFGENLPKVLENVSALNKQVSFTLEDVEELRFIYSQQVRYIDESLMPLFKLLEDHFINNSIILFFSNHGDSLFDNGIIGHGVAYQSNAHVPLVMLHPNIKKQKIIDEPISLIDIVPTIYELLGIRFDEYMGGVSLTPLIDDSIDNNEYKRQYVFGDNFQDGYVREGDWKLISVGGKFKELYNLKKDPFERTIVTQENQELADHLFSVFTKNKMKQRDYASRYVKSEGRPDLIE
tara:strand:- start:2234 stop:3628 length:1395 start_codon:yes stop_codon:yes gene_type:complete